MGGNIGKKYSQKLTDHATDVFKKASTRVIQKTAEATHGNKIADKITRSSTTSPQNNLKTNEEILREKNIYRWQTKTKNYWRFKIKGRLI